MGARAAGGTSCVQIEHSEEDIPGASSEPMEYDPSPVQFRNCLQQRHWRFKVREGSRLPPPKVWELIPEKKDKTGLGFSFTSYFPKPGLKDRLEIPPLYQIFLSAGFINAPPPEVKPIESDTAATLEYALSQLSIDDHLSKLSLDSPMSDSPKEMAMMPPMTSEAIDLAERKMNLSLDDIIKVSKKSSSSKARKPRASVSIVIFLKSATIKAGDSHLVMPLKGIHPRCGNIWIAGHLLDRVFLLREGQIFKGTSSH